MPDPIEEHLESQNDKLIAMLQEAKQHIELLKEEVENLCTPPNGFALFMRANDDGTADVVGMDGRLLRCNVDANLDPHILEEGQLVILNDSFVIIETAGYIRVGDVVSVKEELDDNRILIAGDHGEEKIVRLAGPLIGTGVGSGDYVMVDPRTNYAFETVEGLRAEEVMLEEVPDITYEEIGGLGDQIEVLRDSIELPYLHPDLFADFKLKPPKGILLYGPPGCGKTMIAKAVANSLAKKMTELTGEDTTAYFLNVKGPELLNKYVGETESKLRDVFAKAREKAETSACPVVIFFDEMDSLFRQRGSGISSDMEATVVAQFLSEIDGVESLENVIVVGASNRQDLIDPAVLRPGRLDLKVKVSRPDEEASREIFSKYLTEDLPIAEASTCKKMIDLIVKKMFSTDDSNKFLEVTYQKGDRETLYFKDFCSGAMIENIVSRAKRTAVKRAIAGEPRGINDEDLLAALTQEFKENEDLPNTTNPDDWARISGRKGERIANVRSLVKKEDEKDDKSIDKVESSGQYL